MSSQEHLPSADAIKEIERLVLDSRRVEIVRPPGPPGEMCIIRPDGKTDFNKVSAGWRNESISDATAFVAFVAARTGVGTAKMEYPLSEVWISRASAVFVYDGTDRRDRATLTFQFSEPFQWLLKYSTKSMSQTEIIRTLRVVFRGCLTYDATVVGLLRKLKFTSSGSVDASIKHGDESMGRQIMAAVTGESDLPEEFTINTRVFDNHDRQTTFPIRVALEVNPSDQSFRITPFPGELFKAIDDAVMMFAGNIQHSSVFFGDCPMPSLG